MEARYIEIIDPKTVMAYNPKNIFSKEEILDYIELVIYGCIYSLTIPNTFSSWKNTVNGLVNIKHIDNDFHYGVKLWVNITMDDIIGCSDNEILQYMSLDYPWINELLIIKKYINTYYSKYIYI